MRIRIHSPARNQYNRMRTQVRSGIFVSERDAEPVQPGLLPVPVSRALGASGSLCGQVPVRK